VSQWQTDFGVCGVVQAVQPRAVPEHLRPTLNISAGLQSRHGTSISLVHPQQCTTGSSALSMLSMLLQTTVMQLGSLLQASHSR
jgi:hypothetical protein